MRTSKRVKIKVFFNLKTGKIIYQNFFDINTKLGDLLSFFENIYSSQGYRVKKDYSYLNRKIKPYATLSDLLSIEKNSKKYEIYIEVEQKEDKFYESEEIYKTLLFPKINPFELIEYNSSINEIRYIKCPGQILNFCNLYKFSKESAFCNSENELFMSGGSYNGKSLNYFWIVLKKDYQILKKTMPMFKKYHSMLYIPDNFILIAGGDSLITFIYDIENKQFIKWASMNKKHFQPGLIISGDYAYAFSSLCDKKEENNYFERTDLTSKNPKWEKINPIFPNYLNKKYEFLSLFFGISKNLEDEILILGGEKNKSRYKYNPIVNQIFLPDGKNFEVSFWDKTFYSINKNYRIGIPLNFAQEQVLYFLNKRDQNLSKAICSPKNNKDCMDILFDINDNDQNEEEEGIISIKENNNFEENLMVEEIIFIEDFNKKDENLKLNKEHNKREHLYLPNYILEEQLINRELIHNEENEKEFIIYEIYSDYKNEDKQKYKKDNKKNHLYLPNSIIDDQIVNRQVISNAQNSEKNDKNEDIIFVELNQKEKFDNNDDKNNKYLLAKKPFIKKEHFYIPNFALDEQIFDRELLKFKRKKIILRLI